MPRFWIDERMARDVYQAGVERGDKIAMISLANSLNPKLQHTDKPNPRLSRKLYSQVSSARDAVENQMYSLHLSGDADASFNLAFLKLLRLDIPDNLEFGKVLLDVAHQRGHRRATSLLGEYVEHTLYFKIAAEAGHAHSMVKYAYFCHFRRGDLDGGKCWYWKAVELGDTYAMLDLARFYEDGKYVEQDLDIALYLYHLAADARCHHALLHLAGLCRKDDKPMEVVDFYRRAVDSAVCDQEYVAHVYLADCYITGYGISRDVGKGAVLLLQAVCRGVSHHPRLPRDVSVYGYLTSLISEHCHAVISGFRPLVIEGHALATNLLQLYGGDEGNCFVDTAEKYFCLCKYRSIFDDDMASFLSKDRVTKPSVGMGQPVTLEEECQMYVVCLMNKSLFVEFVEYLL